MGLEAKMSFLKEMETALSSFVPMADMTRILSSMSDAMQRYELLEVDSARRFSRDDLFDSYLAAMSVQGLSAKTIERYRYEIRRFMQAVQVPTRSVTVYHLRSYLAREKARGISDQTLNGVRQIFSSYFGWLWRENLIECNPVTNLGLIKCPKREKKVFEETDIECLKNAASCLRDKAIICFLQSTACRISEMTGLNRDSVDLNRKECTVIGKGDKERTVYLDGVAAMLLKQYLASLSDVNPCLFLGSRGERLQPNGVRMMLKKLGAKTGIEKVHPHKFRRSKITALAKRGMPIEQISKLAGHEKIDTTMGYVVLDKTTVENSYRKYS